jgi:undecaprenyl-diphosphatase
MLDFSFFIFLQIVSESFPVSSSGHIALAICILAYYNMADAAKIAAFFSSSINIFLVHIPTILVVALFFRTTWQPLLSQLLLRKKIIAKLITYAFVADSITLLWYIMFHLRPIKIPLFVGFSSTALLLFSLRWCNARTKIIRLSDMVLLGCMQGIALLPGISRFGIVYTTCRWLGIRATKSFGISWMLQWPLMVAGVIMQSKQIAHHFFMIKNIFGGDIIMVISATIISFIGLQCVYLWAQKNVVWLFSIYMFVPIILSLLFRC